jgi:hypothetical protein
MRLVGWLLLCTLAPTVMAAQDSTRTVTVGAFVDTYYAWDFNRPGPGNFDRSFTTQPARHDEFNVNLALVEVKLTGERVRGHLGLQAGTAVQSNYAGEPRLGSISGPELARHVEEAVAGVRVGPGLWVDAGIYLSHIGQESWISRDNPTYSRSLIADYSPYYETGVKLTWSATPRLTAQLNLVNGWQNISETNTDKAVGLRLDYAVSSHLALGYSNFIGNEMLDTVPSRLRLFNEGFALITAGNTSLWLTADVGRQQRAGGGWSTWYGGAAIGRVKVTPTVAIAGRVERYSDPDGVIVSTGTPNAFRVSGASANLDVTLAGSAVWRIELRGFQARDPIFPLHGSAGFGKRGGFVVTSLALTL